jgi:hypothetical protein
LASGLLKADGYASEVHQTKHGPAVGFKDWLRRILNPTPTPRTACPPTGGRPWDSREDAAAWLKAVEAGCLHPPRDVHDASGWDSFWTNHLKFGPIEQAFADMMSSDEDFLPLLSSLDARTILCTGNGLSTEALSLALHGFHVTALDISTVAVDTIAATLRDPEHRVHQIPGFHFEEDVIRFGESGAIPPELCPPMHRSERYPPRAGGTLKLSAGDLSDPSVCPGPFDVVIERRTVQLFPEHEQTPALERLANRLGPRGLLVSHQHDGRGQPGRSRPHYATHWVRSHGFLLTHEADAATQGSAPRLAYLRLTTG